MFIVVLFASLLALLPVFFIKNYITSNKFFWLVLALLSYVVLIKLYIMIFREGEISKSYVILQIIQILTISVLGFLIYNESITIVKIIGIILSFVTIYMLS